MPDPLADALDAPGLPWLAHEGIWTVQSTDTGDGVDALTSPITDPALVWASTVRPYPDAFRFLQKGNSETNNIWNTNRPVGSLWWKAPPDWRDASAQGFLGMAALFGQAVGGTTMIDQFSSPSTTSIAEGLDAASLNLIWETSAERPFIGFAPISGVVLVGFDGVCARGNAVGAWLQTRVTGPVSISFRANTSNTMPGTFTIDGLPALNPALLGAGEHVLKWEQTETSDWVIDDFRATPLTDSTGLSAALDFAGTWFPGDGSWAFPATGGRNGGDAVTFQVDWFSQVTQFTSFSTASPQLCPGPDA